MLTIDKFEEASEVVKRVTQDTKLIFSDYFSQMTGNKVYFKPENMQRTGAYKLRGAYYKISTLTEEERAKGLITASAGNHAQGVAYAAKKGIPVIIMEPLRGGRLVNGLPKKARDLFAETRPKRSPAEWGLRWLWNQPEIAVVLSGMNSMDMIRENIRIADTVRAGEMTDTDEQLFRKVRSAVNEKMKVPCTGCGYCQPCPYGVDIPGAFRCYNVRYTDNFFTGMREYLMCTTFRAERTNASLCRQCGKCEQHCPQGIAVRKELKQVVRHMENPVYKVIAFFAKGLFKK